MFKFVSTQKNYLEKLYIWRIIIVVDTLILRLLLKSAILRMTFCFLNIFYSHYDKIGGKKV